MLQYTFYFDQSRCSGCDTCTVACKDWNNINAGPMTLRKKYDMNETGEFPNIKVSHLVYGCHHCNSPACVEACPSGAIIKEQATGLVLVKEELCASVGECVKKCPYSNIILLDDQQEPNIFHKARKCTACYDRIHINKQPACVASCPNRALDFGSVDYIRLKYPNAINARYIDGFPDDTVGSDGTKLKRPTVPNLFIKPKY